MAISNFDAIRYPSTPESKVHYWNAATPEERYAQNEFLGRLAAAVLDREVEIGGGQKTSLRTIARWQATDFADVKARLDALSAQLGQSGSGAALSKEEQAAIYEKAVREAIGTYEVRKVEAPEETK